MTPAPANSRELLRVAQRVCPTFAEGPGARFALWVQGCTIRCRGCCNPEMFPRSGGTLVSIEALAAEIVAADVEGLSILGGEPFEQEEGCAELARLVRASGKTVMVYSGYRLGDEIKQESVLLAQCDLLVDGRYDRDLPEPGREAGGRRWIGSRNQKMHFLTDAYRSEDPRFTEGNQVVFKLTRKELAVHGWPGAAKLGLKPSLET